MMEATRLMKSQSSNSGKTAKTERNKSRSNAEFPPRATKKRGVYVTSTHAVTPSKRDKSGAQERPKSPPRPPKGNKEFLASVLTILSKCTTGTQYPDTDEYTKPQIKNRTNKIKLVNDDSKEVINKRYQKGKAERKYRSKALNKGVDKDMFEEQFVVLQSKKDLIHTPSVNSFSKINHKEAQKDLAKTKVEKSMVTNVEVVDIVENVESELAKEILEGRKHKSKRVRIDEPNTLISDIKPQEKTIEPVKSNGDLFHFFVDLLKTTMSDYNFANRYNNADNPTTVSSTKIKLEINETEGTLNVINRQKLKNEIDEPKVNKLNMISENIRPDAIIPNHFKCEDIYITNKPRRTSYELAKIKRRKNKSESLPLLKTPEPRKLITESMLEQKKWFSRKQKKKNLINLFKEQLTMDEGFEEPHTLYQALKVIASNKKQCKKPIHFEESLTKKCRKKKTNNLLDGMIRKRNVTCISSGIRYETDISKEKSNSGRRPMLSEYTDS